jgi:methylated-DNA-[protein]-cysteine S-methyltransferase
LANLIQQLQDYFSGKPVDFTFTPDWSAYTVFQQAVWGETRAIKYGQTTTYWQVAKAIGRPGAARAVGQALHINPLPLVIPCHRVLAHNGSLHGFGGGLEMKKYLLDIEKQASKDN